MTTTIRLTEYSHGAGCGCKIAPGKLEEILKSEITMPIFPNLLVGNDTKDDAAVFDLGDGRSVISTTDFFMPRLLFGRTVEAWVCDETRTLESEIARGFGLAEDEMDSVRINDGGETPAEFLTGLPSQERARIVSLFFARPATGAEPDRMGAKP